MGEGFTERRETGAEFLFADGLDLDVDKLETVDIV